MKLLNILDEKDKRLRMPSEEIVFPLSKDEKKMIQKMINHLTDSQIEEIALKYDIRPGMGLAGPQVGINKRFIVIVNETEPGIFENYVFINPKIVSYSEERIAASTGEGCLSVNREVPGYVPRYARVTVEGFDEDGNKIKVRAKEELSIAFQHEIDHLDGILFFDKIDSNDPYNQIGIRLI